MIFNLSFLKNLPIKYIGLCIGKMEERSRIMKIQETIPNDFSTRNLVRTRSIQPEEKRTRELSTSEKLMEELRNNFNKSYMSF